MNKIVTLTLNPALDVNTSTDEILPEKKIRCKKPDREPGGGGINVSRALKRLGVDSTAVYIKGGSIGEIYEGLVKKEGLDQIVFETAFNTRENITVKDPKQMFRFVLPGAELKEEEWQRVLDKLSELRNADYLVASGSLPPGVPEDFYARVAKIVKKNGIRFILDTSKKPLQKILDSGAYLIKPNKNELNQLLGKQLKSTGERKEAALEVVENYDIQVVVVSLGADGAILATQDGAEHFPSPSLEKKDSAVGAGDSMLAGIVYSLIYGHDMRYAVKYGLACGSAALLTPGTELVHKEDANSLFYG